MCGRFGISFDRGQIENRFGAKFQTADFRPRYNAAPSQALPVILNTDPKTIQCIEWGLRPRWLQKIGKREGLINVRAETLREKQTFNRDLAERRCLVLADSFYEWKKGGRQKVPYRILLQSGEPFAFAGIWEENEDSEGKPLKTFAIITTDANELVQEVHTRMPVILRKESEHHWLDYDIAAEKLFPLLVPYPAHFMQMYEISTRVNRTTEDSPDLIQPLH